MLYIIINIAITIGLGLLLCYQPTERVYRPADSDSIRFWYTSDSTVVYAAYQNRTPPPSFLLLLLLLFLITQP